MEPEAPVTKRRLFGLLAPILVAAGCDSSSAPVARIVADLKIEVLENESVYEARDGGPYEVTRNRDVMQMTGTLSGTFRKIPRQNFNRPLSDRATNTDLPETDKGEYDRFEIVERNGTCYLVQDEAVNLDGTPTRFQFESEIRFTRGSWSDYRAGRPVAFESTEAGLAQLKAYFRSQIEQMLGALFAKPLRGQIAEVVGGTDVDIRSTVACEILTMPNVVHKGDLKTIRYAMTGPMTFTCKLVVVAHEK